MIQTITLEGGKTVELAANAATPFRFKQLFNADLFRIFHQSAQDEAEATIMADVVTQLAFIMNKQAEGANMNTMSMEDFYSWLEDYEPMDFVVKGEEIIKIYLASAQTTVEAKKKQK